MTEDNDPFFRSQRPNMLGRNSGYNNVIYGNILVILGRSIMSKVLAYLRTSTDKQDLNHQKLEILEYACNFLIVA